MIRDLRNLVLLYIDADEYYLLKKAYKLSVEFYCKNVDLLPTENEKSYLNYNDQDYFVVQSVMYWASYSGYTDIVKYIHLTGIPYTDEATEAASGNGQLHVVKYLYRVGAPYTHYAIDIACAYGQLKTVKYLHKIGITGTYFAVKWACFNAHLKVLDYLYKIGAPYIQFMIIWAGKHAHYDYIDDLREKYGNN